MDGYWEDEEKTAAAITEDKWMRTGDMAVIDAEGQMTDMGRGIWILSESAGMVLIRVSNLTHYFSGYCKIVGRYKDLVIRGGENIYPTEVEELLYQHPDIAVGTCGNQAVSIASRFWLGS